MKKLLMISVAMVAMAGTAKADEYELTYKSITELTTDTAAAASGDFIVRWDESANKVKKVDATDLSLSIGTTATAAEITQAADISANQKDVTTATTLTTADCGDTVTFSSANGLAATLPSPITGCQFTGIVAVAPTSGNHAFYTADANAEIIKGIAFDTTGGAVAAGAGTAAADTLSFIASTAIVGDRVNLWSDGTNWYGVGYSSASGGITYTSAR